MVPKEKVVRIHLFFILVSYSLSLIELFSYYHYYLYNVLFYYFRMIPKEVAVELARALAVKISALLDVQKRSQVLASGMLCP